MNLNDEKYMREALKEAYKAKTKEEIPVGVVIVLDDKIIARAHNTKEKDNLVISHAEINAIKKASKKLNSWRLENTTLYSTLEPCQMCFGAIEQARIKRIVYGASDQKSGAISLFKMNEINYSHKVDIESGILEEESSKLVKDFFIELRR